jgi:hypothetical protein
LKPEEVAESSAILAARFPRWTRGVAALINLTAIIASVFVDLRAVAERLPSRAEVIFALQLGAPCLGILLAWSFRKGFSVFHGLTGNFIALQRHEQSLWLFGVWFPTFYVPFLYYKLVYPSSHGPLVLFGCLPATAILFLGGWRDPNLWRRGVERFDLATAIALSLFFGYSLVFQLNCMLDTSTAATYQARVIAATEDRRGYLLEIEPWGSVGGRTNVSVSRSVYMEAQSSRSACLIEKAGAFQIPWYVASLCGSAPRTPKLGVPVAP